MLENALNYFFTYKLSLIKYSQSNKYKKKNNKNMF